MHNHIHRLTRALFIAAIVLCLNKYQPVIALQSNPTIEPLKPITGVLGDTQTEQRWTFNASKGQRVAVRMQATSGDLDPHIELLGKDNAVLSKGINTSLRNATIDAFVIPDDDTYTLRATRTEAGAKTSGSYTLSLLPGFSFLVLNDPTGTNAPMRTWQIPNSFSHFANNTLELQLTTENSYTWTTVADRFGTFKDLYLQADFTALPTSKYWEAGLILRGARLNDTLQFYVFFVNSDGKYKLAFSQESTGLQDIQEWKALPVAVQQNASLGMMVKESQFTLFYSGQPLAELKDEKLKDAGSFGVAIGTGNAPNNNTTIRFKNFIVTLPADEANNSPIIVPEKLTEWQRAQESLLNELIKLRLVPGVGKTALEIKTKAFVTNNTGGGIVMQPLAESMIFSDLVYSADVTWESSNENIACALELRAADDSNFTIIYFDRKGGYGIRQVSKKQGDKKEEVPVAIYNLSDSIIKDNLATNRVTIVAVGNNLIVYMNGTLLENLNVKQTTGGVRIAAYNYERASSRCDFTNLWLRSFDQ